VVAVHGHAGKRQRFAPSRLDGDRPRGGSEPDEGTEVVLREVAAPGADLADLLPAAGVLHGDPRPDGEGVRALLPHLAADPVMSASLGVLEQRRLLVHGAHHEVRVAVVVEVADRHPAAALLHGSPRPAVADTSRKRSPSFRKTWSLWA
jgi:hypothetical protein